MRPGGRSGAQLSRSSGLRIGRRPIREDRPECDPAALVRGRVGRCGPQYAAASKGDTMSRRTRARHTLATHIAFAAALLLLAAPSFAEDPAPQPTPLPWALGGGTAPIGDDLAEIDLTDQYVFLDAEGTKQLMELTQNPATGVEVATIAPAAQDASWFLVFEYEPIGYVPDDEKDQLDAEAMLQSIKEGTEQANEERKE